MLLPKRLLIWVVTDHSFQTRAVDVTRQDLEAKVQDFLGKIRSEKPIDAESKELYNVLIRPVADLLNSNQALAIIPDRALHGLPFSAIKAADDRFLIQQYPIIVSPTLTHLLAVNKARPKRDSVVTFGSRSEQAEENHEIEAMRQIYKGMTQFSGQQVTKTSFLDAMARSPVFHYAGHSARDASDPLRSAILLDGNGYGPNSVTAIDIAGHRLPQNALVVLSSCDSSVGSSKDGIGMRGLTSAFLISGAGAVVGSLWPVESRSTADLMIGFHKAFAADHVPVAQALRQAQTSFLEMFPKHAHPYYWSGFTVTGNYSALR